MLPSSFVISLMYLIPFSIQELLYIVLFSILMFAVKKTSICLELLKEYFLLTLEHETGTHLSKIVLFQAKHIKEVPRFKIF